MSSTQLATLATVGWALLTLAMLVIGTWGVGETWTILPGLVRGVRDWAAEHAAVRSVTSPGAWSTASPRPRSRVTLVSGDRYVPLETDDDRELDGLQLEGSELVEIEDLGTRSI